MKDSQQTCGFLPIFSLTSSSDSSWRPVVDILFIIADKSSDIESFPDDLKLSEKLDISMTPPRVILIVYLYRFTSHEIYKGN